jgi:hypothetical protein
MGEEARWPGVEYRRAAVAMPGQARHERPFRPDDRRGEGRDDTVSFATPRNVPCSRIEEERSPGNRRPLLAQLAAGGHLRVKAEEWGRSYNHRLHLIHMNRRGERERRTWSTMDRAFGPWTAHAETTMGQS